MMIMMMMKVRDEMMINGRAHLNSWESYCYYYQHHCYYYYYYYYQLDLGSILELQHHRSH